MAIESLEHPDAELLARRGEGTRYALIMAGLELFGEYGLKATSTRMLAERAGANVASIPYHFGSKDGLYLAVVEYIVERVDAYIGETARDLRQTIDRGPVTREQARDALEKIIRGMAGMFVDSDEPKAWAQIVMREQASPTEAFDVLYKGHIRGIQRTLAELIAAYTGLDADGDEVKLRTHALIGQVLGFLVARESLLRHLGAGKLEKDHIEVIHRLLGEHARACLGVPPVTEDVA